MIRPTSFWITLCAGNVCQFRCSHCFNKNDFARQGGQMELKTLMRLIMMAEELKLKQVYLSGGEPFLAKHFWFALEQFQQLGIKIQVPTNGAVFANPAMADRAAAAGIKHISISMKGVNSLQYEQVTKTKNGYADTLKAIFNLRKAGIDVGISSVMTRTLANSLDEFFSLMEILKPASLFLNSCRITVKDGVIDETEVLNPRELAKAFEKAYQKASHLKLEISPNMGLCLFSPEFIAKSTADGSLATCCSLQGGTSLSFYVNGEVQACNSFSDSFLGKLGDDFYNADTFLEWWNSEPINSFRSQTRRYPAKACIKCPQWMKCGGGCIFHWMNNDPEKYLEVMQNEYADNTAFS